MASIENHPALVLNADFRPLSYLPLSLWHWQDAIKASFQGRVNVVSEYEYTVSSPSIKLRLPSVIALKEYIPRRRTPVFTRFNVFLRDSFRCQYCSIQMPSDYLTFDHVVPKSKGGNTSWENVVTSCQKCNLAKGNRLLKDTNLTLHKQPVRPSQYSLQKMGTKFPPNFLHESWEDYLYWDSVLEQ